MKYLLLMLAATVIIAQPINKAMADDSNATTESSQALDSDDSYSDDSGAVYDSAAQGGDLSEDQGYGDNAPEMIEPNPTAENDDIDYSEPSADSATQSDENTSQFIEVDETNS